MTSPLALLKSRKTEIIADQVAELPVPLWTRPSLRLRITPVEHEVITRQWGKIEEAKGGARSPIALHANAAIVAKATTAVLIGDGEDQAEMPLHSPDLREALGLAEKATGVEVIRAMCLRDADVIALGSAVAKHSGYADEVAAESLRGE